jgi:hypothetical protein
MQPKERLKDSFPHRFEEADSCITCSLSLRESFHTDRSRNWLFANWNLWVYALLSLYNSCSFWVDWYSDLGRAHISRTWHDASYNALIVASNLHDSIVQVGSDRTSILIPWLGHNQPIHVAYSRLNFLPWIVYKSLYPAVDGQLFLMDKATWPTAFTWISLCSIDTRPNEKQLSSFRVGFGSENLAAIHVAH